MNLAPIKKEKRKFKGNNYCLNVWILKERIKERRQVDEQQNITHKAELLVNLILFI